MNFARLIFGGNAHNTIVRHSVSLFFQQSPLWPGRGADRGIDGLDWYCRSKGGVNQRGTTGADGRIDIFVYAGKAKLQLRDRGTVLATYDITVRTARIENLDDGYVRSAPNITGLQRRLRVVGYQLGQDGTEGYGVTGQINRATDRVIQELQCDAGQYVDGRITNAHLGVAQHPTLSRLDTETKV